MQLRECRAAAITEFSLRPMSLKAAVAALALVVLALAVLLVLFFALVLEAADADADSDVLRGFRLVVAPSASPPFLWAN